MIPLISAALLLSIDSAVVSFALGLGRVGRPQQNRLAVAFGLCDGAASLVGIWAGVSLTSRLEPFGHWAAPALVAAYALLVLWSARAAVGSGRPRWPLYLLPAVMSLDNLAASYPLAHAASPLACAAAFGLVSGLVSIAAFRAGEAAAGLLGRVGRSPLGTRAGSPYLGGTALLMAAVLLAVS